MRVVRETAELREALSPSRAATARRSAWCRRWAPCTTATSRWSARRARTCDVVVVTPVRQPGPVRPRRGPRAYPRTEERRPRAARGRGGGPRLRPRARRGLSAGLRDHGRGRRPDRSAVRRPRAPRRRRTSRGVTTVVAKLFNAVEPDVAFFGQKDAQQVAVIRRMARDLDFPVRDRGPADGPRARRARDQLAQSLPRRRGAHEGGGASPRARGGRARPRPSGAPVAEAIDAARAELAAEGIEPEYVEARDAEDLTPAESFNGRPVLVALAARIGSARLIDNVVIEPRET